MTSLPVPVSPVISTEASVSATCLTLAITSCKAADSPTKLSVTILARTSAFRYKAMPCKRVRSASA